MSKPLNNTSTPMAAVHIKSTNKHIFRALLNLASVALLVRIMGMLNQVVVSSKFGAGAKMDAYFIASLLPLLLAELIINAVEASVIPIYIRIHTEGDKEQEIVLFSTILNLLLVGTGLLILVMLIFRQQIFLILTPALDSYRKELAINLTPFIYPVILLMVVNGFLECILNAQGLFGWPSYAGLLVPLTSAILVLTVGRSMGISVLCIGMLVGLCLQICVQIIRVRRAKLIYRPLMDLRNPEIRLILSAAWPVLFGSVILQAAPLIDQMIASFFSAGTISALSYALKITSVFAGVIFASLGRSILPYISRQVSMNDLKAFKETLRFYMWIVGISTTLLGIFMIAFAHPIVQLLFQRGAFSSDDTNRTATILIGFLVGLPAMAFDFITFRAFSALGKTKILMLIPIFTVTANALFDYIFIHFWQGQGIALATSAVYFCILFFQLFTLRRMIGRLGLLVPPSEILEMIRK
jgi:putative peptidoglycan lipid II flippase